MNEREINKLRKKFIVVSTICFFTVMLLVGGLIFFFSETGVRNEALQIMNYIVENDGELPEIRPRQIVPMDEGDIPGLQVDAEFVTDEEINDEMDWSLSQFFGRADVISNSLDVIYSTRYFAVLFDDDGIVEDIITSHIADVNEKAAIRYAEFAMYRISPFQNFFYSGTRIGRFGRFGRYFYYVAQRNVSGTIVIYLDRRGQISGNQRVLTSALVIICFGSVIAFILMLFFSKVIVRNEVSNVERQKQFITNASHELKTPLAVIRGNTEMQEMLSGETEWTQSTLRQVERMDGLIRNLVLISRAQEAENSGECTEIDISKAVRETAESFSSVAISENKRLTISVENGIMMICADSMARQLTSLLVDNAVKYCDPEGEISVSLSKKGKTTTLQVSNSYAAGEGIDYNRFFERFYRADESHTQEKGGFGIGLSVAENIIKSMHGTMTVSWKDGSISFTCRIR